MKVRIDRSRGRNDVRVYVGRERLRKLGEDERGCRRTYVGKRVVVKLNDPWYDQNRREVRTWNEATPSVRRFLAPILAYAKDRSWLMQKRVSLRAVDPTPLKAVIKRLNLNDVSTAWWKPEFTGPYHNWGSWRGRPVIYDYAI